MTDCLYDPDTRTIHAIDSPCEFEHRLSFCMDSCNPHTTMACTCLTGCPPLAECGRVAVMDDQNDNFRLANVLRALLSVGEVSVEKELVEYPMQPTLRGYRLTIKSSVLIDGSHEAAIQKVLDP